MKFIRDGSFQLEELATSYMGQELVDIGDMTVPIYICTIPGCGKKYSRKFSFDRHMTNPSQYP
ncbi:hypothetical protein MAR_031760 [Mya arenaria]|uniref:C2H2-type domain-containing protein n=1 Tax=Mya arenaria TaxID=6604 RepID=A0ABY7F8Q0_MYAAR|nr:hypothetical protein MAR_031760 [Mya arenaria]